MRVRINDYHATCLDTRSNRRKFGIVSITIGFARHGITWTVSARLYRQNQLGVTAGCAHNACTIEFPVTEANRAIMLPRFP